MYHFFAYGVQTPTGDIVAQIFNNKENVVNFCKQQNIHEDQIVQLFNYKKMPYTEPKDVEFIEP